MSNKVAAREGPAGPMVAYACPMCGGQIEGDCRCGRTRTGWLYPEEVIVIPATRANGSGGPHE